MKPLGMKAYGRIPHLPGSRLGPGDHHCHEGQATIATKEARRYDNIIVQEKLDGSCCAVLKHEGKILALGRSGHFAASSNYTGIRAFSRYVDMHKHRFDELLREGERVVGEWLAQAVGTRYNIVSTQDLFVPFDIMTGHERLNYADFHDRIRGIGLYGPNTISIGPPLSIEEAMYKVEISGHGAMDPVEGAIWRVEHNGVVDFLVKYVRPDKEDGKYFPELNNGKETWNFYI